MDHLEHSFCENTYDFLRIDRKEYLCAGDLQTGRDTCRGDSGGPLMHISNYKKHKVFVQYGVVANGGPACNVDQGFPGIYSSVLNYLPWITNTITL